MLSQILSLIVMPFYAAPNHSSARILQAWGDKWCGRAALQALTPGFPRGEPSEGPTPRIAPPIPTDVPVPTPTDVPVPDPGYAPPREPGNIPNPARPRPDEVDPRPRSAP
jgi:hypothetical protein